MCIPTYNKPMIPGPLQDFTGNNSPSWMKNSRVPTHFYLGLHNPVPPKNEGQNHLSSLEIPIICMGSPAVGVSRGASWGRNSFSVVLIILSCSHPHLQKKSGNKNNNKMKTNGSMWNHIKSILKKPICFST